MAASRYGTVPYGTTYYGGAATPVAGAAGRSFTARATGYDRVLLQWTRAAGTWRQQRVVRTMVGFPVDQNDGVVLLDEPTSTASRQFVDLELTAGRFYYYALFVLDVGNSWRRVGTAEALVTTDHGFTDRMHDRLPQVFRGSDYSALADQVEDERETLLYRYLSAFGFQLDHVRSELESLRAASDARLVSGRVLPALAHQVGVTYEPELGDRFMRRLVANATHLWGIKGTLAGARELATILTGWHCDVRLGHNIALDRLDAGPDGGRGRWTGRTGCTAGYAAFTDANRGPAGAGALVLTSTGGTELVYDSNPAGTAKPLQRLQYAIPIIPNLSYVVSQYQRTAVAELMGSAGVTWLDAAGVPVGATTYGPAVALADSWSARPDHVVTAPSTARYLEVSMRVAGTTVSGNEVRACGLQVQEGLSVLPWAPAREVVLYLAGELENYVGNTSGRGYSAEGWQGTSPAYVDGAHHLTFDIARLLDALYLEDAFSVTVTGDVALVEGGDVDSPAVAVYTAAKRQVEELDTWSVLVDVVGSQGNSNRQVQVGFALYDGDTLIGYDWGPLIDVALTEKKLGHQLNVPTDTAYDRVAFAIRSSSARLLWRSVAMEKVQLADAVQFDGSTPSATGDYAWSGVPFRSTSLLYRRRAAKTARLRELLEDFLPHPANYRLAFGVDVIPDSPRSSAGSDLDPDDNPLTAVSARLRLRWSAVQAVHAVTHIRWSTLSNQVAAELGLVWSVESLHKTLGIVFNTTANITSVGVELTIAYAVRELVDITDAVVVDQA